MGLSLAGRAHLKYRPVFDKLSEVERAAAALCFLPHGQRRMCWLLRGRAPSSGTVRSPTSGSSPRGIGTVSTCTRAANTVVNTATSPAASPQSTTARTVFATICARTWKRWRLTMFRPRRCIYRTAPIRFSRWSNSIGTFRYFVSGVLRTRLKSLSSEGR